MNAIGPAVGPIFAPRWRGLTICAMRPEAKKLGQTDGASAQHSDPGTATHDLHSGALECGHNISTLHAACIGFLHPLTNSLKKERNYEENKHSFSMGTTSRPKDFIR